MEKKIFTLYLVCILILFLTGCIKNNAITPTKPPPSLVLEGVTEISPTNLPSGNYLSQSSKGLIIAMAGRDYGSLFLVETETGTHWKLEIPGETGTNIYGWSKDGCTLFVETKTNRIVQIDIKGNIIKQAVKIENLDIEGNIIHANIAPNEEWIGMIFGTGNQEYASYEFQNLITASLQNAKTYQLTNSGVVRAVAWKSDSSLLAYNNNDIYGIQQVFISKPDGSEKVQLTHFTEEGLVIRSIKWSPNGENLAFTVIQEDIDQGYINVVDVRTGNNSIDVKSMVNVYDLWWASNDLIVADILSPSNNSNASTVQLSAWYNPTTGEELGRLDLKDLPNEIYLSGLLPPPFNKIGFFSGSSFYTYDIASSQIEQVFNKFTDIRYWISEPQIYDGEICKARE